MDDITQAFARAVARHQAGDFTAAESAYRAILQQVPTHPATLCNLGSVLARQNRPEDAARCYALCLAASPSYADAHYNLANLHRRFNRLREAVTHYQSCLSTNPNHASAWFNLGLAAVGLSDLTGAATAFRKTIALEPDNADAHNRLGDVLLRSGDVNAGVEAFRQCVVLRPDDPRGLNNLALALTNLGRPQEAVELLQKALKLNSEYAEGHNTFALACEALGHKDDATHHYQEAVRLKPEFADAWSNLGTNLTEQVRADEAIEALRQSLVVRPLAPAIASNLLLTLNYTSRLTAQQVADEHRQWQPAFAPDVPPAPLPADTAPNRRLNIGYISGDFRAHTVAGFIDQLFTHHDRNRVKVFAYANVTRADDTTARLNTKADEWRFIAGLPDDAVADRIRADAIDVLVDLSGHTANNRLLVLARRPAPVQMTLFGYPNTTGLSAVDYRLTDDVSDPPGMTEHLYAEGLWRLPQLAWMYSPPTDAPAITPLPSSSGAKPFTFGCLNNAAKISEDCCDTWARLIASIPGSRLVLMAGQSQAGAKRLTDRFVSAGILRDRLQLVMRLPRKEYFESYQLFDLALDPFPYNGGVTTCDALWMGVPVLTVAGNSYVSRQGAAVMTHVGLSEFVADTPAGLIDLAKIWASNRDMLADIRGGLRSQLAGSSVADGRRYCRALEEAYRTAWQQRLARG
jgi:protein O-GlcNAc transferase